MPSFPALMRRVSVALPGIGAFAAIAFLDIPFLTVAFFSTIALLCGYEAAALLDDKAPAALKITVSVLTAGCSAAVALLPPGTAMPLLLFPGALAGLWWMTTSGIEDASGRLAGSIGLLGVVSMAFGLLAKLRLEFGSPWMLFIPLFICWAGDSSAYFAGVAFGRHRLAPRVSPAKSWEGFAAGMAASMGGAVLAGTCGAGLPAGWMLLAGAVGGAAGVLGDLFESALKRNAGVKDSGSLLPGHGGFLDRFDSILGSTPAVWLVLAVMISRGAAA
jgi:phosphatidate cytidylyltransferase